MTRRGRSHNLFSRALGILLMIPGLLQVPLPQVDFHVIRHHHGTGEVCPKHDHLLRWHPQAGEGEDVAVLHWHWLLPRSASDSDQDASGRSIPALHAHDRDQERPDPSAAPLLIREAAERQARGLMGSAPGLDLAVAGWLAPPPTPPPILGPSPRGPADAPSSAAVLSRLVRRNC